MSLASLADADLVARCRTADQAAWRELVERFSRYVHAIATRAYRLSPDDAADVFQEVFARTYEQLDTLSDDAAIRPWIGQLTRRLCIESLRRGSRETAAPEALEALEAEDVIARLDESLGVHRALATLPADCREILDRFFCRDESYLMIGEALGLPPGTIASRISRCLGKLRDAYEGRRQRPGASRG